MITISRTDPTRIELPTDISLLADEMDSSQPAGVDEHMIEESAADQSASGMHRFPPAQVNGPAAIPGMRSGTAGAIGLATETLEVSGNPLAAVAGVVIVAAAAAYEYVFAPDDGGVAVPVEGRGGEITPHVDEDKATSQPRTPESVEGGAGEGGEEDPGFEYAPTEPAPAPPGSSADLVTALGMVRTIAVSDDANDSEPAAVSGAKTDDTRTKDGPARKSVWDFPLLPGETRGGNKYLPPAEPKSPRTAN